MSNLGELPVKGGGDFHQVWRLGGKFQVVWREKQCANLVIGLLGCVLLLQSMGEPHIPCTYKIHGLRTLEICSVAVGLGKNIDALFP